jgi:predicted kinase
LELAARLAVPATFIICQADPEAVQTRLSHRRGDASDADWSAYQRAAAEWQEPGPLTRSALRILPTSGKPEEALLKGINLLRELSLLE